MVTTDALHHTITVNGQSVELQPLSFQLFVALNERRNEIVSPVALTAIVWGDVAVAPDTLKQRVFLLRKALEDADIEGCTLQSVRGQGYRLIVDGGGEPARPRRIGLPLFVIGALIVLLSLAAYWLSRDAYEIPANNRIVFWSDVQDSPDPGAYREWRERWISRLSTGDSMMLVASDRDPTATIPEQARRTRSALVSLWSAHQLDGRLRLRMQLLEPKTASILLSADIAIEDRQQVSAMIEQQYAAIVRILGSGILPLDQQALIDTDDPAWAELRQLAADPD